MNLPNAVLNRVHLLCTCIKDQGHALSKLRCTQYQSTADRIACQFKTQYDLRLSAVSRSAAVRVIVKNYNL